jgi:Putative peptidoglycan binding domain/D-alanyl-D-alanine carboxypeptidase
MDAKYRAMQLRLQKLGFDPGPADGLPGKRSQAALVAFQRMNGLEPDGLAGPKTMAKLEAEDAKGPASDPGLQALRAAPVAASPAPSPGPSGKSPVWPRQADVRAFFGQPGSPAATAGTVHLPAPMRLAWDLGTKISTFRCHAKCAEAFAGIMRDAFAHYGEKRWRELGLDLFGGCYNLRAMRGGTEYSMHSYGIAVDLDPARNQLTWTKAKAAFARPEYDAFWAIVESYGALSLGRARNFDWMHFQFARL